MAHGLEMRCGEASMFYVGEAPWHGLGTALKRPATAAEAIQAARLDWEVVKKPLVAIDGRAQCPVPDRFAVIRADLWGRADCPVLGLVGGAYRPLQNREAFAFFDPIVGQGAAIYHTAGVLGRGERIWVLARLPSSIRVAGDDQVEKYLLLSNSHDGTSSVQVKFTPVRVVCQNTLTLALARGPGVRVAHLGDLERRLGEAARLLGLVHRRYDDVAARFRAMAAVPMNGVRLREYLGRVFRDPADPASDRAWARVRADRAWATHFFDQGAGNRAAGVRGTLWAAYNGVTEYVDHRGPSLLGGWRLGWADRRLRDAWFGGGYLVKARAYAVGVRQLAEWAR